jgi:hypothetical protein
VGGIQPGRSSSVNSVHSVLRPTRSISTVGPLKAMRSTAASPRESTPLQPFTAAPSGELTPRLNPLSVTLTKNKGEGADASGVPGPVIHPGTPASSLAILPPPPSRAVSCEPLALSLEGSTVSSAPASVSPLSATLTKRPGGGSPATHSPTRRVITPRATPLRTPIPNHSPTQAVSCKLSTATGRLLTLTRETAHRPRITNSRWYDGSRLPIVGAQFIAPEPGNQANQ